jgi:outer membrane lipoprotein-sorting protein
MTTGHRIALALLVLGCLVSAPARTQGKSALALEQLMKDLAQVKSARGTYVERKHLAMLNAPLESSGTLVYVAPGRLEKHMLSPRRESLILDGDQLIIENKDKGQRRTFPLQEHPVLWAFVESVRSTLTGDLATLQRFYEVRLEGDADAWRLRLKPKEVRMRQAASEIRVGGSGTWVSVIEIDEAGGDRSVTTITREAG